MTTATDRDLETFYSHIMTDETKFKFFAQLKRDGQHQLAMKLFAQYLKEPTR